MGVGNETCLLTEREKFRGKGTDWNLAQNGECGLGNETCLLKEREVSGKDEGHRLVCLMMIYE